MTINGKRQYELLNKIGFIRVSGSEDELKAAHILMDEIKSLGLDPTLDRFKVDESQIVEAKLCVTEPYQKEYHVTAYKCCGNCDLEGEFYYAQEATNKVDLANIKDKIVLVNGYLRLGTYKKLIESGAKAFITFQGTLLEENNNQDLDTRKLRSMLRKYGVIPGVNMMVSDALDLVVNGAKKVKMTIKQEECEVTSHNVYATIEGTENKDERIVFGAHFDSVPFSTGVYDNGAGSVIIMDILREFVANPPKRTVQFCWFGSEEVGLEGSKHYTKTYQNLLDQTRLMINVDVAGSPLGKDVAMVTGPTDLVSYIDYLACQENFSINASQDLYSSDSTPFADKGIPSVSFCRFGASGSAFIHCRHDIIKYLTPEALENTCTFVNKFAQDIVNSPVFPVKKEMPEEMVKKIDEYLDNPKK